MKTLLEQAIQQADENMKPRHNFWSSNQAYGSLCSLVLVSPIIPIPVHSPSHTRLRSER